VRREGLGRASDFFSTIGRPTRSITVGLFFNQTLTEPRMRVNGNFVFKK
jgi:hypothetical protein